MADYISSYDGDTVDAAVAKVASIEDNATADQTGAEIKTAYENEDDTNAFTDAEQTKLSGIDTGATADELSTNELAAITGAAFPEASNVFATMMDVAEAGGGDMLASTYDSVIDANTAKNTYPSADETKVAGIEALADVTSSNETSHATVTTASSVITNNTLVRGDGGSRGQQDTGILVDDDDNVSGAGVLANAQTGTTYQLVASDAGKLVTLSNSSAVTLTVPSNGTVAFRIGTIINLLQLGSGQVTVELSVDTLHSSDDDTKLTGQYSAAALVKTAITTWVLFGDLTA